MRPRDFAQITAWICLALACAFSINLGLDAAAQDRAALAASAREAVRVGCEADRQNAVAFRAAINGNIEFVKRTKLPEPPTRAERIRQLNIIKNSLEIPNCDQRVKLITLNPKDISDEFK